MLPPTVEIRYPPELPITERRDDIIAALARNQVVVVAGETGSGKSTQLPKICLEAGLASDGLIGHTQPRRIAARAVAERVAEELGEGVGGLVGYTVRFTDKVGESTRVKVMTDGILLGEIQRDRKLRRYQTLIIDEAHERSLNIDFILGYLKQLLPARPDLKVIVTSATIDTARFSAHFAGAPVVEVSGRTYPVEVRYRPLSVDDDAEEDRDQTQGVIEAVRELATEAPGDILVFLSGEREIRDTSDALSRLNLPHTELLPLYARLSSADQHRVFQPHTGRRIVLATNVAETSLTVPGIRYVIDPGTARISRYSRRTKVQRLPIEAISQASANQRAGRCGRVAPGICIRLYSEEDFQARPEFTEPEILRTNLASVILQMTAIGLGDVAAFPFVDAPDPRSIKDGVASLEELGALAIEARSATRRLTPIGRQLAQIPLDPRFGRMLLEAHRNGCLHEVMVITAALSIQDPRERPLGKGAAAEEAHRRFAVDDSDFIAFVRLWEHLRREQQQARSSSQFRKLCRTEFLNYLRVREWQDLYSQLRFVAHRLSMRPNSEPAPADAIHRSLLAGLLSHIGMRRAESNEFLGARSTKFLLGNRSALAKKPPRWVMAAELVETNRTWAGVVARIQPEWAEALAGHLVKRSYSDPWWDARRGSAMCNERVTLYGLPIVTARRVHFSRVDVEGARDVFIREALVEGDWETDHTFVEANRKVVDELRALHQRSRRHDVLVGAGELFDFYDARVPADVTSGRHFDRWWKGVRQADPDHLTVRAVDLVGDDLQVDVAAFPDAWRQGALEFPLSYEFDATSDRDGVTVSIPLSAVEQVDEGEFSWQVPGLREELVTTLLRSLPKATRRDVGPAPDLARPFVASHKPADGPLPVVLASAITEVVGYRVLPDEFDQSAVPDYLRMTFRLVNEGGHELVAGKDLAALRRKLAPSVRAAVARSVPHIGSSGLREWS
ncbi:MAG: ATP-dependent RNA helicase HrpA, partial [Acidimicrobiia bacterium]